MPWLEEQIGTPCMDVIRTLKKHFDPNDIMNLNGMSGLDIGAGRLPSAEAIAPKNKPDARK